MKTFPVYIKNWPVDKLAPLYSKNKKYENQRIVIRAEI